MNRNKNLSKNRDKKNLSEYRSKSFRHVLHMEADMLENNKRDVFHDAEIIRQAGNKLTAYMQNNYKQMTRTKRYRGLLKAYGKCKEKGSDTHKISSMLNDMQKQYNVTWDACRKKMIEICKSFKGLSIFALAKAEDVWSGVEKVLYSDGKRLHFSKRKDTMTLRAKQINRGITIHVKDGNLIFKYHKIRFQCLSGDRFVNDELNAVIKYLESPEINDEHAVKQYLNTGQCISTYRPCYATLICQNIRGKLRVFLNLTIEGTAKPKYTKDGRVRHTYGKGRIGCDIGTQTIAYTSDMEAGLKNLAERGKSIRRNERQERLLNRQMDRSRRAMNPENYNEDGTIKKGKKTWVNSKRYNRLKDRHDEYARKAAENRHYAIDEDVNYLRSIGDDFVTEQKNAEKLQKKAKHDTVNKNGKHNRRKRFGRSIKNRCPGYFQEKVKQKFESTGGEYHEVPSDYRASQYDHTADDYIKKKLSQRMYNLSDGTKVQRDWYSSFLLFCADDKYNSIDKSKCEETFTSLYQKEIDMIDAIIKSGIKVFNSGIAM